LSEQETREPNVTEHSTKPNKIIGWHCHVYFLPEQRNVAVQLNEDVQDHFRIWDYRWLDEANPLHPTPMFRFQFPTEDLARFVEWITLNRNDLSVLLHAITGDDIFDHTYNAMWLGKPLTLNIDGLRELQAKMASGELPSTLAPASQVPSGPAAAGTVRYRPGDDPHLQAHKAHN
jgi:DOPA 4,5-dioxygenase